MRPPARWRRDRAHPRAATSLEPLEGRASTSYLVVARDHAAIPVHVADARADEPLFSNGLAVKRAPSFYGFYTGPRRPELDGVRAMAYVSGTDLILSGTVVGPIPREAATAAQGAIYTFAIDRGGASRRGPFPDRPRIRFDAVVVAEVGTKGPTAYVQINDPHTNQPGTPTKPLPTSSVSIRGDTITMAVPLSLLPSSGHAIDQWNVNFFVRNPSQRPDFRSVASLTPEFTEFQVSVQPPPGA